jgi:hypothetical protein
MLNIKFDFVLLGSLEDETCGQTVEQGPHTWYW